MPSPLVVPASPAPVALPASCGPVGAEGYVPLPYTVPEIDLAERGDVITVTTTADTANGSTSNVAALAANPGADGLSLREAIEVTNAVPGAYTIRFAPSLKGGKITVGGGHGQKLPHLTGGNVFINGDVDADGTSDVSLLDGADLIEPFSIASSGNRIHALTIEGFRQGVMIAPQGNAGGATLTSNVVSKNTIRQVQEGILIAGPATIQAGRVSRSSGNSWMNTHIIGNSIDASAQGVGLFLPSAGDRISGVTIAMNSIRIGVRPNANGIQLSSGFRAGSTQNRIEHVLIVENTVEAAQPAQPTMVGIWVQVGTQGATRSVADDVRITRNVIRLPTSQHTTGIDAMVGDGATDDYDRSFQPIEFPEGNTITNLRIDANTITGPGRRGVIVQGACCGGQANVVDRVTIEGNVIESYIGPGSDGSIVLWGGNSGNFYVRPTEGGVVSNTRIARNTVRYLTPSGPAGAEATQGGISLLAAVQASRNAIRDVLIVANEVETDAVGISIVGAKGSDRYPTTDNTIRSVEVSCSIVRERPSLAGVNELAGIALVGGWGPSSGNTVEATVRDTLVVDRLNDVSVVSNMSGATGNTATLR